MDIDWGMLASGMPTPAMDPLNEIQRRWPTPGMTAETMPTMPSSPITPEALAAQAAARGIPPPKVDLQPQNTNVGAAITGTGLPGDTPFRMPGEEAVNAWRGATDNMMQNTTTGGPSVGAPMDLKTPAQKTDEAKPTDMSSQNKPGDKTPSFADTLRGTKMPTSPELQKLGTPAAPRPTGQIKGGEILALLQAMSAGGAGGGLNLPSTLGQALLGRK